VPFAVVRKSPQYSVAAAGAANNRTLNSNSATGSIQCLHGFAAPQDRPESLPGSLVSLQILFLMRLSFCPHYGYGQEWMGRTGINTYLKLSNIQYYLIN